jgi:RNA polymerase sigma-70 factor (family 1)
MPDYKELSDQELFDLLKENNQSAFTEIYDRYKVVLHRYAYKWLQDRDAVKDVIQDIFTMIWTKRDTITFNQNLSGYLYISVRNAILRKIQQEDRKNDYANSLQEYADKGVSITDHLLREKQLKAIIEQEISALPDKMREVFELSRNKHLSHAEIAEKMGISEQTVRAHVKKALKILRGRLGIYVFLYFLLH